MKNNMKVMVIGLDGATLDLIKPWAEEGVLPNFKKFIENGAFGNLKSTLPILSPPAWTSIVTGKNPGKHGIYEFWKWPSKEDPTLHPVNSKHRKSPAIWNILSKYGVKSIVINVPVTYPPEEINGIIVSGMLTPSIKSDFTYPKEIKNMLLKRGYEIGSDIQELSVNRLKTFLKICQTTLKRAESAIFLIQNYPWSFFFVVFRELDSIQHYFWDEKDLILKYYKILDDIIGRFLNFIDKNTTMIIVSDHGFGPVNKAIYINVWLNNIGLLKRKELFRSKSSLKILFNIENKILEKLYKLGAGKIINLIPTSIIRKIPTSGNVKYTIDFSETKAYCLSFNGQYLKIDNDQIYFKNKEIIDYLIRNLYEIIDTETKVKIIKRIIRREKIYWGPYLNKAPDLLIEMIKGYAISPSLIHNKIFGSPLTGNLIRTGDHELNGIFMAYGPNIKNGLEIDAFVWDVTPTILQIMGFTATMDMDGKILKEIFQLNYKSRLSEL